MKDRSGDVSDTQSIISQSRVANKGLNANSVRLYFKDMLKAIHYCHETLNVIHKDIKPDNIVLGHTEEAILIDFGTAVFADEVNKTANDIGTYLYFAPELFSTEQVLCGKETDIWALGMSFY